MKKVYLCAIALSVGSLSYGQAVKQKLNPQRVDVVKTIKSPTLAPQDKGITVWSDDFSNSATWTLTNTSAPAQNWIYETDPTVIPVLTPNPVNFTTASNGYLYIDSDNLGGAATQLINATNVTPIDLTGLNNVSLTWEQDYISFQEIFTVSVSGNNGSTWTDYIIPGGGGQTRVYETKNINISAVAGGQSQVLVRFTYSGAWDWMWAVDDVSISVTDDNDMEATEGFYGFGPNLIQYTRIPVMQISPADFSMRTTNVGSVNQTNAILTADVNAGTFIGTSTPITNMVGATDSLFTTTQYTPGATVGVPLNITLTLSSDSTDATPSNNAWTFSPVEVSQYVYAHDDYSATPGNGGGYYTGVTPAVEDFEAGNYFDIIANQTAYAIDVMIGANAEVGAIIDVVLYDGAFTQLDRSAVYVIGAADIGNMITLTLPATPALNAGDLVFAAVHGWGGTTFEFFYGTSGSSTNNSTPSGPTSLLFYPSMSAPNTGQNFFTTQTPMIRLNFDPNIGINELSNDISFSVYPNPSTGEFTIDLANTAKNVNLTVKNVVGKTIIDRTVSGSTKETISLSDYSKGIYFLTINNETTKLIVE